MDYSQLKVFVAGHNGLVSSALCRAMARRGYRNIVTRTRAELNLLNSAAVEEFFRSQREGLAATYKDFLENPSLRK